MKLIPTIWQLRFVYIEGKQVLLLACIMGEGIDV